jgi:hypothetical protein
MLLLDDNSVVYIKGQLSGVYVGDEEPIPHSPAYKYTYDIDIQNGAVITSAEILENQYSLTELLTNTDNVLVDEIAYADIFFSDTTLGKVRERVTDIILVIPKIVVTGKDGIKTYGRIDSEVYATIGIKQAVTPPAVLKEPVLSTLPTIPINTETNGAPVIAETPNLASRSGCLPIPSFRLGLGCLLWPLFLFPLILWLISMLTGCPSGESTVMPVTTDEDTIHNQADSIKLNSREVNIMVYDWSAEDGDVVSIYLNGQLIKENLTIKKQPNSWLQKGLKEGNNLFEIKGINEGTMPPASPTFEINDGYSIQTFRMSCKLYERKSVNLICK